MFEKMICVLLLGCFISVPIFAQSPYSGGDSPRSELDEPIEYNSPPQPKDPCTDKGGWVMGPKAYNDLKAVWQYAVRNYVLPYYLKQRFLWAKASFQTRGGMCRDVYDALCDDLRKASSKNRR